MTRDQLLRRLSKAREGSRELDFWCWWYGRSSEALKPTPTAPDRDYVKMKIGCGFTDQYTIDVGAAMSMPNLTMVTLFHVVFHPEDLTWEARIHLDRPKGLATTRSKSAALAVSAAWIQALAKSKPLTNPLRGER